MFRFVLLTPDVSSATAALLLIVTNHVFVCLFRIQLVSLKKNSALLKKKFHFGRLRASFVPGFSR